MEEHNCCYCKRKFELTEIVVSNGDKLFCAPEHAPLEENSCALEYIKRENPQVSKSYYFIKLEEEN